METTCVRKTVHVELSRELCVARNTCRGHDRELFISMFYEEEEEGEEEKGSVTPDIPE